MKSEIKSGLTKNVHDAGIDDATTAVPLLGEQTLIPTDQ